jgi:hypothetical protein
MSYAQTTAGISSFLAFLSDKGLVPQGASSAMRTACDRVFSALSVEEQQNLAGVDVDAAVRRFINKNPGALSPASANVYRSRVHRALEMLQRYNSDPAGFKPEQSKKQTAPTPNDAKPAKNGGSKTQRRQAGNMKSSDGGDAAFTSTSPSVVTGSVTLTLPLRVDFVAQFIVPRDLTSKEAKRLGAYFATVAIDYEPS